MLIREGMLIRINTVYSFDKHEANHEVSTASMNIRSYRLVGWLFRT